MDYVLDTKRLYDLVNSFYAITKTKVVIMDKDFNAIVCVPPNECDFCARLQKSKEAFTQCMACEKQHAFISKDTNKLEIYKCHIGLTEAISPIKIGNIHIGYIMLGQIIDADEKEAKKSEILSRAEKFTKEDMSYLYDTINTKTKSEIQAAAKILEACACYLVMKEVIKENSGNIAFEITNYINDHLTSDITVDSLCKRFYLSRNTLYDIFSEYFQTTVAKYIRKKRIERALELIKSGIPISRAATLSGYEDYSYFSKAVKKETGLLPSQIKKSKDVTI